MTGGAGAGVGAAGCTGVVGTVESHGEFQTFSRKVVKTGSGATIGGAAGASVSRTGSAAGGSMLIGAGAGPALAASR